MNTKTLRDHTSRGAVLAVVVVGQFVWSAGSAVAESSAQSTMPVSGPVGIAAVIVGVGGFIVGLCRRRKLAAAKQPEATPVPLPGPRQPVAAAVRQD